MKERDFRDVQHSIAPCFSAVLLNRNRCSGSRIGRLILKMLTIEIPLRCGSAASDRLIPIFDPVATASTRAAPKNLYAGVW